MSAEHLNLPTLTGFASSNLDTQKMIAAGRHLFTCSACRARLRSEVSGGAEVLHQLQKKGWGQAEVAADYDDIFDRLQTHTSDSVRRAEEARERAPDLAQELLSYPSDRMASILGEDSRYHSAALIDLLLEQARALSSDDPDRAEEIAYWAVLIADHLDPTFHGHCLGNDLKARGWAYIGNARRIRSDLGGAQTAFLEAECLLEEGSGDPIERAQVLDLKASLLRAQRRLSEALSSIKQVVTIYRNIGDRYREGRALISTAAIHGYAGEPEKGIPLFFSALKLIDPQREPHLVLAALNNLIVDLTELGRLEEAQGLLPAVRACAAFGNSGDRARVRWSEALLLAAMGKIEEAESNLQKVRDEFIAQGIGYDTALVSLDLAKIYLGQGRISETRQLAAEMHTIFVSREIHREALVALVFFQKAAEQERATVQLVEEVTGYLKRAHGNPGLHFERPT